MYGFWVYFMFVMTICSIYYVYVLAGVKVFFFFIIFYGIAKVEELKTYSLYVVIGTWNKLHKSELRDKIKEFWWVLVLMISFGTCKIEKKIRHKEEKTNVRVGEQRVVYVVGLFII